MVRTARQEDFAAAARLACRAPATSMRSGSRSLVSAPEVLARASLLSGPGASFGMWSSRRAAGARGGAWGLGRCPDEWCRVIQLLMFNLINNVWHRQSHRRDTAFSAHQIQSAVMRERTDRGARARTPGARGVNTRTPWCCHRARPNWTTPRRSRWHARPRRSRWRPLAAAPRGRAARRARPSAYACRWRGRACG